VHPLQATATAAAVVAQPEDGARPLALDACTAQQQQTNMDALTAGTSCCNWVGRGVTCFQISAACAASLCATQLLLPCLALPCPALLSLTWQSQALGLECVSAHTDNRLTPSVLPLLRSAPQVPCLPAGDVQDDDVHSWSNCHRGSFDYTTRRPRQTACFGCLHGATTTGQQGC
jgi:hypothetical protein